MRLKIRLQNKKTDQTKATEMKNGSPYRAGSPPCCPLCYDRHCAPSIMKKQALVFTLLVLLGSFVTITKQANWAQSSGEIQQNVVIPAYPSPAKKHFQPRYGHAVVVVPKAVTSGVVSEGDIYLMGGDTYTGTAGLENIKPGLGDITWNNGYKNDVWKTPGTEWLVKGDHRYRNKYHQKKPKVTSQIKWTEVLGGYHPTPGLTYDDFIICERYFASQAKYASQRRKYCASNGEPTANILWSPRRHHAAVYMNEYIYVMGGRAREFVDYKRERSIGGIEGPHVNGVPNIIENRLIKVRDAREAAVYKNDVWKSKNGLDWTLVTPGCKAPQDLLLAKGNARNGKIGELSHQCTSDDGCWGAEKCDITRKVCYCPMWSAREQMAVAVYQNTMYLSGGYASRLFSEQTNCGQYACGDTDAGSYRYYMPDVWSSTDGEQWVLITSLFPEGRGGHQMLVVPNLATGIDYLWVVGGRSGDNDGVSADVTYHNDIVVSQLPAAVNWYKHTDSRSDLAYYKGKPIPWAGRVGHTVTLEPAAPVNLYTRVIYIVGGYTNTTDDTGSPDGQFLEEVWSLRPDLPGDSWRLDFEDEAIYFTGERETLRSANHSPSVYYVTPDSNITYLRRLYVPNRFGKGDAEIAAGKPYEVRPYLTDYKVSAMMSVGINSIRDLATADQTTILKLRGVDTPDVPLESRLQVLDVCDFRALAIAVVQKCSVTIPKTLWDGEMQRPYNQNPEVLDQYNTWIEWHKIGNQLPPVYDDIPTLQTTWDGCTYNEVIQGIHGPTIEGIGYVEQVTTIREPLPELQELHCRWTPGPRAYHAAIFFDEKLQIFGGKESEERFKGDTWYRDNKMPMARFDSKPLPYTDNPIFLFTCNEPGCIFEYRVWDPYNYIELREWTQVVQKTDVGWLDWRMDGPGDGIYMLFVRAIDAAGNRDERYFYKLNVHEWYYVSPTPWDIIAEAVGTFIGLGLFGYLEYRRRVRRAAMERYAMKRMRRKFKAMQRDIDGRAVDWRSLYMENKEAEQAGGNKKNDAMKKKRDKKAEKREKERLKREKEKEKIKRKMKGDTKEKKKDKKTGDSEKEGVSASAKISVSSKSTKEKPSSKEKGEKKFKDYEKGETSGDEPSAPAVDPSETGTKQRKANKRYKEYETGGGGRWRGRQDRYLDLCLF